MKSCFVIFNPLPHLTVLGFHLVIMFFTNHVACPQAFPELWGAQFFLVLFAIPKITLIMAILSEAKKPALIQQPWQKEHLWPRCKKRGSTSPSFKKQPFFLSCSTTSSFPNAWFNNLLSSMADSLSLFPTELTKTLNCFQVISRQLSRSAHWRCCRSSLKTGPDSQPEQFQGKFPYLHSNHTKCLIFSLASSAVKTITTFFIS